MTTPVLPFSDRFVDLSPAAGSTALDYDFELKTETGLTVVRYRAGAAATLVNGTDYDFLAGLGTASGGTITLLAASLEGDRYVLAGLEPIERASDLSDSQAFSAARYNEDGDKLTIHDQEQRRDIDRAIKSDYGQPGLSIDTSVVTTGKTLMRGTGDDIVAGPDATEIAAAQGYAEQTALDRIQTGLDRIAAALSAVEAAASAAGVNLPAIIAGSKRKVLQVKYDELGHEFVPGRYAGANVVSLLDYVTDAERADIVAATNSIDITSKVQAALAGVPDGAALDLRMLRGTVDFTADIFAGLPERKIELLTGQVTIRKNFNLGGFRLPGGLKWKPAGTIVKTSTTITNIASDSSPAAGMIETHIIRGTCSGVYNTKTVTVSSSAGLSVGSDIGIFGVNVDTSIATTLGVTITASDTSFTFGSSLANAVEGGLIYIAIASEVILGTLSSGIFTVTTRGANGTTAAAHTLGDAVIWRNTWITRITAIAGTTLTVQDNNPQHFSATQFCAGVQNAMIDGDLLIDGDFDPAAPSPGVWEGVASTLSRAFRIRGNVKVRNCAHGGVLLFGTRNAFLEFNEISACGHGVLGGLAWTFGSNYRSVIKVGLGFGPANGILIDNKSSSVSFFGLDRPNTECSTHFGILEVGAAGYDLSGSSQCAITVDQLIEGSASVVDNSLSQLTAAITMAGNSITIGRNMGTLYSATGGALASAIITQNGSPTRYLTGTATLGAPVAVTSQVPLEVAYSLVGTRATDVVTANPTTAFTGDINISWVRAITDGVTVAYVKTTTADGNVPVHSLTLSARGPW